MLHVTQRVYTTYLLVLGDGGRSGGVGNIVVHVEFDEQCVVQIPVRFGILFVFAVPPQHPQFVVPVREHLMPHPRSGKERGEIHAMLVLFNEFLTIMNFWRSFLTLIIFGQHLVHFSFDNYWSGKNTCNWNSWHLHGVFQRDAAPTKEDPVVDSTPHVVATSHAISVVVTTTWK